MKNITREMIKIYDLKDECFMGYKLDRHATFHHIKKREEGGLETIENGAVLNPDAHEYLHIIEFKDYRTYLALTQMLWIINLQKEKPSLEQYKIISYLLKEFEYDFKDAKTSKGKKLIKEKYLDRKYY